MGKRVQCVNIGTLEDYENYKNGMVLKDLRFVGDAEVMIGRGVSIGLIVPQNWADFLRGDTDVMPPSGKRLSRWISVNERLPEEYGEYLAVVHGEVMECCYAPSGIGAIEGWSTCNADGFTFISPSDVSFWMPLPEPPLDATATS